MTLHLKSLLAAGALAAATVGLAPAFAQTTPAATLGEVLARIRQDTAEQSQEAEAREAEFRRDRDRQQTLLNQALAELAALEAEGERLNGLFNQNDERIRALQDELRAGQGDFGELFGVARQAALDISGRLAASNIAVQPGLFTQDDGSSLIDRLRDLSAAEQLPTRLELDAIWKTLVQEMIHQREVVTFQARVANIASGGATAEVPVTRIGGFTLYAMDGGSARFVNIVNGQITVLARQPADRLRAAAASVARTDPGRLVAGPVDPSSGTLLGLIVDSPTFRERIDQGGIVGYVTLALMAVGVAFGLLRMFQLFMTNTAVRLQARSARAGKGNPLGRIMLAADEARTADIETFELKLDDAIIRESAGLDFGLNFLKLAAGVAPLLGLLGTVTGMIQVFQQITLFGTGDPKIMADGISQALVTTVIGLVAAIPLLLIHSFASSASRGVQQVLEEQSAGIVAQHAESRRGGGRA
jgi:biopolymer transport protein ExbB